MKFETEAMRLSLPEAGHFVEKYQLLRIFLEAIGEKIKPPKKPKTH